MPFKAYHLSAKGELRRDISETDIRDVLRAKDGLLWVDVRAPTGEDGQLLMGTFDFHHLAVEDCMSRAVHHPKIDDFGDYLFVIVHGINHAIESDIVETAELAIFMGPHFVVSSHHVRLHSVDSIARLVEEDGRPMRRGADFLVHALMDALVDNVLPTIDRMSEVVEDIEEEAIARPQQSTLEAVMRLKRSAVQIHRITAPQREVLNRLGRREFRLVTEEAQIFYRDVYDHMVRIEDLLQSFRDRVDSALATYLSSMSIRQNETMKVLSIVAAIFLPLSLVAGIYGMNFENMPELEWSWSYFAVLGLMGLAVATALWWFWARSWITWGRRQVRRVRPFAVETEKLVGYLGHIARGSR